MGWPVCNTTEEYERINEDPVWRGMTFHRFGLVVSAIFASIAVLMSCYLVWRHATHYLKPWEQKHIIRVLFMVPIYATVSFLSYLNYRHAVYFEVIRDCYEAFAIASFFALLCHYIAPDLHNQKDFFRMLRPIKGWVLPLSWFRSCFGGEGGILRTPRSGLTWFNIIWFGVFQYCFVRVFMTLVALVTQATGRYCLESLNPAFAHIWVMVIEGGCVTIAMYCLIQFYLQLKNDLSEHRPLLKIAAIKLVIFLSFWQTLLISFFTSTGLIKSSKRFATPDIKVGIPSFLLCIEMAIFSVFHLWAFPWKVYAIGHSQIVVSESVPGYLPDPNTAYKGGRSGIKALKDAFNPWDLIKAVGRGFKWFAVGRKAREQDISYKNSVQGTGLEPVRTTHPYKSGAPVDNDDFSTDPGDDTHPYTSRKPARYRPLSEDEEDNLLSHAQPVPHAGPYSHSDAPYAPYQTRSTVDIGTGDSFNETPEHSYNTNPPPGSPFKRHSDTNAAGKSEVPNATLDGQDTEYHGARLAPALPTSQHLGSVSMRPEEEWYAGDDGSRRKPDSDPDENVRAGLGGRGTTDLN